MSLFDIECTEEESSVVITPVNWEVTTSYGGGTSLAPDQIREASVQIDHFSAKYPTHNSPKYFLRECNDAILKSSQTNQKKAQEVYETSPEDKPELLKQVNEASEALNDWVYQETKKTLEKGKIAGSLGGDHSIPYGAIKAISEKHEEFSILHIDAHHDFREAYFGFTHSHASIFYNVMKSDFAPNKLVQVGIRDYCQEEYEFAKKDNRISVFYDTDTSEKLLSGQQTWLDICHEITSKLSQKVYISFDIDGLEPALCPGTGTPVPGGLNFSQWQFLLDHLIHKKHQIIGFDLVEVASLEGSDFDANIGMRILYGLCRACDLTKDF